MIRVGIVPKVLETYKEQFELSVENNLLILLKKEFKINDIDILTHNSNLNKYDVFISSGGNDIKKFSKDIKDKIRNLYEMKIINHCIKKKTTYVGICYGAQFVANIFGASLNKSLFKEKKRHNIKFVRNFNNIKKNTKSVVNSFHNYKISKINNNLIEYAVSEDDNSTEFFKHKNKKIYGIMWHPERFKKINTFHKILIKDILCN